MIQYERMQNGNVPSPELIHIFSYCPLCQKHNERVDACMLGAEGSACVWHVRNGTCGHALLAMVLKNKELMSSVALATDLSAEDVGRILRQKSVSLNDVLRTHELFARRDALGALREPVAAPSPI